MFKKRSRSAGLTMIEILIALAVFGIILTLAMIILLRGQSTFSAGVAVSSLRRRAASSVDRIATELRMGGLSTVEIYDGGVLTNTTGNRVDFRRSVGSDGYEPVWGNTVSFRQVGDRVIRYEVDSGGSVVSEGRIVGDVTELHFERTTDAAGAEQVLIRLSVEVRHAADTRPPYVSSFHTTVTFRN